MGIHAASVRRMLPNTEFSDPGPFKQYNIRNAHHVQSDYTFALHAAGRITAAVQLKIKLINGQSQILFLPSTSRSEIVHGTVSSVRWRCIQVDD